MKSSGFHEIWQISGEIHPKPYKIRRVFAETSDFIRFGGGFHLKSAGFHVDFMKSGGISCEIERPLAREL